MEQFYSKVAGVSHRNDDGSDRQTVITMCSAGETLYLIADPANQHSRHAVRVVRMNGQQLGHLPDETARGVTRHLQAGGRAWATINALTGGTRAKPTRGVNLIVFQDGGESGGMEQPRGSGFQQPQVKKPRWLKVVLVIVIVALFLAWLSSKVKGTC